jgi:hypothetical protein
MRYALVNTYDNYTLTEIEKITPCRFIKVHYASVVDWRWKANIIRANPSFHSRPRYDHALVQVTPNDNKCIFIQLIYIFQIQYLAKSFDLALVLPLDNSRLAVNRSRDEALRLTRLCPRRRSDSIIIDANTIIRGGLVSSDLGSGGGELLINNFIDEDMWMRLKKIDLVTRARL